ncbi:MAG TPA: hypothetical protein VGW75_14150 [Solirubrobacteraceae bacterium]|jgi:pimeloyl-ACP methyl ester carboxylesterase|nr:hypothetical protein [Solirubrobacteraceae bacterium]
MTAFDDEVRAEAVQLRSARGQRLFGLRCEPCGGEPRGLVVMPPGYERRIHHHSVLSRFLVRHGYATLRFDLSNHLGLSEGEIAGFKMSSMTADVLGVLAGCADAEPRFVVASSLAARATVRALASEPSLRPDGAVLILPVIDTEATTTAAIGRNVVDDWRSGRVRDRDRLCRVLDHDVRYAFSEDVLDHGFDGVEGTLAELAAIACPVLCIAAERDDWVDFRDVERAMAVEAPAARATVVLEASSHDLAGNLPVARALMGEVLGGLAGEPQEPDHLDFEEIVETVNRERGWKAEEYRALAVTEAR